MSTNTRPWLPWFAWHPVRLIDGRLAWLRTVHRRQHWVGIYYGGLDWEYDD